MPPSTPARPLERETRFALSATPTALRVACLALSLLTASGLLAQTLRGRVADARGAGVPFASVFLEELGTGTAADELGDYYLRLPRPGRFRVLASAVGYETSVDTVTVGDGETVWGITLREDAELLREVVVRASRRDSGYAIMREVIARRRDYLRAPGNYSVEVYVRAREDVRRVDRRKRGGGDEAEEGDDDARVFGGGDDAAAKTRLDTTRELNFAERQLLLHHAAPDRYKEERLARRSYGETAGLWLPTFGEADVNFYRARVDFGPLTKTTIVSPLSPVAVLNYRFRHLGTRRAADGRRVYEVAFEPRKRGNATAAGTLVINDSLFNLRRVEATLPRGALRFFEALTVTQDYARVADSLWLPVGQEFRYGTSARRGGRYDGVTAIRYGDFALGVAFADGFFGGEVALTRDSADLRDSVYWAGARTVALDTAELRRARAGDSLQAVLNSAPYKDSVDAAYNRVTALELLWDGVGFQDHRKRSRLYFPPLPSLLRFNIIGGWRYGLAASYFRRFPDERSVSTWTNVSYGDRLGDLLGDASVDYRYDPRHLGTVSASGGRVYESIFDADGIRNQLSRSNYIEADRLGLEHARELINGLVLSTGVGYTDRRPAPVAGSESFLSELLDDAPPVQFEPYQALVTRAEVAFTPFQRYLTEPRRKVVLGSDWPTLRLRHRRGWRGLAGSDIDFDYLEAEVTQRVEFGALGNLRYTARAGQFVNARDLRFVDLKRFRRADPLLYFDPAGSFQSLDTTLATTRPFFELHALHYFNGALVNTLPLVRRTRVEAVAGAGLLLLEEGGFRHQEAFAGLERVFKLGPRRRLRLGVYGVLGDSSGRRARWEPKLSVDVIDTWRQEWSF